MRKPTSREKSTAHSDRQHSRAGAWLLWIFLLFVTGLLFLFSAHPAGKTVFFFVLFLPFISLLYAAAAGKNLSAAFSLPDTIAKHAPVTCRLILTNRGIPACPAADIHFFVRNDLTGEAVEQTVPASVPSRGSTTASFAFSSEHCGQLQFRVTDVFLYDWFGLFRIRTKLAAAGTALILPETFPCEILVSLPYSEQGDENSQDPLRGTEDPSELYALRDYQPGDPVKQIHWKLTAKRDLPVIKEISRPVSRTLLLFWKKTAGVSSEASDALAEAFASAALSLNGQRIPFLAGWQDKSGSHIVDAGDEASLFRAISRAVQHSGSQTGSFRIPEEILAGRFAKILWFSGNYPFEEEPFLPIESTVFLCTAEEPDGGERYTVCFTPAETGDILKAINV